jgi:hypothetical protein
MAVDTMSGAETDIAGMLDLGSNSTQSRDGLR